MKNNLKLSDKQSEAVQHNIGALLVVASAGSGKTRVLTERIKRLVQLTKRKILAITFTNKAGEEMKERLGNDEKIKSQVFIGTFHSFCQTVLESRYKLVGLQKMPHIFEDDNDRIELIEQAINSIPYFLNKHKNLDVKGQRNFKYEVLNFISQVKRELLSKEELFDQTEDEDTVLLYHSYQEILQSQNAIDFDDLIMLTYNLFINNPSVAEMYRRNFEFICIDEAQDLNNAQYQLLKSICGNDNKNIMMVGDPNQSIFAFNGSNSDFMTKNFVNDYQAKTIELKENYRSSRQVLEAAEKIMPDSNDIVNLVIPGIFEIHSANNEYQEAEFVYNKIVELVKLKEHNDIEGEIAFEKIAVLARNRYVFSQLETIFKENDIPFYFKTTPGAIKFETDIMKIFDLAFRVRINPDDKLHWGRLINVLKINLININSLNGLVNNINNEIHRNVISLVLNLAEDGSNFKLLVEKFKSSIEQLEYNSDDEKKMIIDEISELLIHWYQYAKKTEKKSLSQFKNAMALGQTNPNTQQNGITLSTVHTMKGQEYDIVFIIGMDEGTFPDYRAVTTGGIELIQEKNNAYVAFTRSKRFLFVSYPIQRQMPWGDVKPRAISRFLKVFNN